MLLIFFCFFSVQLVIRSQNPPLSRRVGDFFVSCVCPVLAGIPAISLSSSSHFPSSLPFSRSAFPIRQSWRIGNAALSLSPFLAFPFPRPLFRPRCPVRATSVGAFSLRPFLRHCMPACSSVPSAVLHPALLSWSFQGNIIARFLFVHSAVLHSAYFSPSNW